MSSSVDMSKGPNDSWIIDFKGGIAPFMVLSQFALQALVDEAARNGVVAKGSS